MSKARSKRDRHSKPLKGIRAHKTLIAWLLGVATMLGGFAVVLPRPSVIPSDPVDPDNPMSASFTIVNNNIVPLRHVMASIYLGKTTATNGEQPLDTIGGTNWSEHSLNMDDRFTISPDEWFGDKGWADSQIAIVISYDPWFFPTTRKKVFKFKTYRQTNGKLYWYSIPDD